ncbi:MAG: alpha-L-fucosidase [Nibricoccus sp.]
MLSLFSMAMFFAPTFVHADEPMQTGKFDPTWASLQQYEVPEWFRDAKFGIWAHWGPQCQPEQGDWYGRYMYVEGHRQNLWHVQNYGPPSKMGFKDVINSWKADKWEPEKLLALYKRVGAQYFFAMANHHDNFDLWNSKYQPWNSTRIGPKKDIIAGWAKAARAQGLRFGVSVHAAHAWTWYEFSQSADKKGALAGVPYDGKLTAAEGKGQWWDGLNPQDLYAQNHTRSQGADDPKMLHKQWDWGNGASVPDAAYCQRFYNRTVDLINQVQPDLIYFDDTALPLHPISDVGLKIAAHFYNSNMEANGGKLEGVLFGKVLNEQQRKCMVWDIERGQSNVIEPLPWQCDTCLGGWHYDRSLFEKHRYKTAKTIIQTLADVVSKNGNLLLSVPVRGDGTIDADEVAILEDIAGWMAINRECIFDTRPWKICGEGPALTGAAPLNAQGFNEGKGKPLTSEDVRFTQKGDVIYIIQMGVPKDATNIKSMGNDTNQYGPTVAGVTVLGSDETLVWSQTVHGLIIAPPTKMSGPHAHTIVYKVLLK